MGKKKSKPTASKPAGSKPLGLLFLDPHCTDVDIKSAESDGVSAEWAHAHFRTCRNCRNYDSMVRAQTRESVTALRNRTVVQASSPYELNLKVPKGTRYVHLELS